MNPYIEMRRAGYLITRHSDDQILVRPTPDAEWLELLKHINPRYLHSFPLRRKTRSVLKPKSLRQSANHWAASGQN